MDSEEIKKRYMDEYNKLVEKYHISDIRVVLDNINNAIKESNIKAINENYNKISDWNILVAHLEGARLSLDSQFPYWHLPSPVIFSIVFDQIEKRWKFDAEVAD